MRFLFLRTEGEWPARAAERITYLSKSFAGDSSAELVLAFKLGASVTVVLTADVPAAFVTVSLLAPFGIADVMYVYMMPRITMMSVGVAISFSEIS